MTDDREDELETLWEAGSRAWPDIALDRTAFARYLEERSADERPSIARAPDLYLACACASSDPAALAAFDREIRTDVARMIVRAGESQAFADEVMQILSVKLFVRTGEAPPAIADYAGRSSLKAWVTTAAKRTGLNLRRNKDDQPHAEIESGIAELDAAKSPELALLKAKYKHDFERAIRTALGAMPPKARTLLLLHLANGVTLPQLAAMQKVSRATVARWLASAREELQERTMKELVERLRVPEAELQSVLELVRSQLELSLARVASETGP